MAASAAHDSAVERIVIENCAIATVDANDTEYASGHIVIAGNRIESIGAGKAPENLDNVVRRIDGTGHLVTPVWSTPTTTSTSGSRVVWPPTTTSSTGWSRCTPRGRASTSR